MAGSTGVTLFMAEVGLESSGPLEINAMLEASGEITNYVPQEISVLRFVDPAGTPCLSLSYVLANEDDEFFAEAHPPLKPYN